MALHPSAIQLKQGRVLRSIALIFLILVLGAGGFILGFQDVEAQEPRQEGLPEPVGYWRMNEVMTGTQKYINSATGMGDANVVGALSNLLFLPDNNVGFNAAEAKKINSASMFFDGDDYIHVDDNVAYDITVNLSMAAWVRLDNPSSEQYVVGKFYDDGDGHGYVMGIEDGNLFAVVYDADGTEFRLQAGTVSAATWTHIAMTWEGNELFTIYVNGLQVAQGNASQGPIGHDCEPSEWGCEVVMGGAPNDPTNGSVDGYIDEVLIYDETLSADDVAQLSQRTFFVLGALNSFSCNSSLCGLSSAINAANVSPNGALRDRIHFNFDNNSNFDPFFPNGFTLTQSLPSITDPVIIDATSLESVECNDDTDGSHQQIYIDGDATGVGTNGFTVEADNVTIKGFDINYFDNAGIYADNVSGLEVACNYIVDNSGHGIHVEGGSDHKIGSTNPQDRNIVVLSGRNGIYLDGTSFSSVQGNHVGTSASGSARIGNGEYGIEDLNGVSNVIGGLEDGARNLVSANSWGGIQLFNSQFTSVQRNYVGTNLSGTSPISNTGDGILIQLGMTNTVISNLVSGNGGHGIFLNDTIGNVINDNRVGTNISGTAVLPNNESGIFVALGQYNQIGDRFVGNHLAGNGEHGLWISRSLYTQVFANNIGRDGLGFDPLPNQRNGVFVEESSFVTIGGDAQYGNAISGNVENGIEFSDVTTSTIVGNFVGVGGIGLTPIANGQYGIAFNNSNGNTIGSSTLDPNTISANSWGGINLLVSNNNTIIGNNIGTNKSGLAAVPNNGDGIKVELSSNNVIGGETLEEGNLISSNQANGIILNDASDNLVYGNRIGLSANGTTALGNQKSGVFVALGDNNKVGDPESGIGNVIGGNVEHGVLLGQTMNTVVAGNTIGGIDLGNGGAGVFVEDASNNRIGVAGSGNTIVGNGMSGVVLTSNPASPEFNPTNGNPITFNKIYANNGMGIDLGNDGRTANDSGDLDSDNNNLQNFPELYAAELSENQIVISGTLTSLPVETYLFDLFFNDPANGCQGEEQFYEGTLTLNNTGTTEFELILPLAPGMQSDLEGKWISALVTRQSTSDTSEFSECVAVTLPSSPIPSPEISLSPTSLSISEGAGQAELTVQLSISTTVPISVSYQTGIDQFESSPATGGIDFSAITDGILTIPAGATSGQLSIPILEDSDDEEAERFQIEINLPSGTPATLKPSGTTATITIEDNDDESDPTDPTDPIDQTDSFLFLPMVNQ